MSTWWWVILGVGLFLGLSVVAGVAFAAILGQIGRESSKLLESQLWTSAPLARELRDETEEEAPAPAQAQLPSLRAAQR